MSQTYTNLASSTLASSYTAGDSSITVATGDGAKFPTTGNFTVAVGQPPNFFLQCTARTDDTLTVDTSATEGTTAANASSATAVTHVITAGVLDGIRSDQNQVGLYSSLPTSGMKKGDSYKCSDSPWQFHYDGSVWQPLLWGWYNGVGPSSVFDASRVTTLNGAISDSVTTLVVSSNYSSMPTTPFWVMIGTEQLKVTTATTTTWTVARGDGGTTAASHVDTTPVKLMNFHYKGFTTDMKLFDTGTGIWSLDNRVDWDNYEHGNGLYLTLPYTTNYTITCCVALFGPNAQNYVSTGTALQDTAANKWIFFTAGFYENSWHSPGGVSEWSGGGYARGLSSGVSGPDLVDMAAYPGNYPPTPLSPIFLRVQDDGTNLNWYTSFDGYNWLWGRIRIKNLICFDN